MERGGTIGGIWLAAAVFLAAPALLAQTAPFRSANEAPLSWRDFSLHLKTQLESALLAEEPEAKKFRDWCAASKQAPGSIIVKVWINPDGALPKVTFQDLADAQATKSLRTVLTTAKVSKAPPPDMPQPVTLRIALNFQATGRGQP